MAVPGTGSTNQSLTFAAAKKVGGKAHTSNLKEIYNETIPSNIQISTDFVFGEDIPQTVTTDTLYARFSASAGADPTVEYVEFYVQSIAGTTYDANDGTFGDVGFGGGDEAQDPGPHGYQLVLTSSYEASSSNPNAGSGFLVDNQVINASNGGLQLVHPLFGPQTGNNYVLEIYTAHPDDGGLQIPTTSPIEWLVDYYNGTIFVQDYISSAVPTYARGFIYIGKTAKTLITEASSSGGGGGGNLSITGDTGSDTITIGSDTLNFSGSTGIDTTVSTNKVSFELNFDNLDEIAGGLVAFGDKVALSDASDSDNIKKASLTNIARLHAGAVATTGLVNNNATLEINVTGLNVNTAVNDADTIILDDGDAGSNTKMTRGSFLGSALAKFNNGLTATTISASSTLQAVGSTTLGSTLDVSGAAYFADYLTSSNIVPSANETYDIGEVEKKYENLYAKFLDGGLAFTAINDEGDTITRGQAVYIKGISGNTPTVALAAADDANKMPAMGLVADGTANNATEVRIVTLGALTGFDTSDFSEGDTLYVQTGSNETSGSLTATPPTGSNNLIQNIARVLRSDASAGTVRVGGAGRTNATENLDEGHIFVGNSSDQAVQDNTIYVDSANNKVGINDTSPSNTLTVGGSVSGSSTLEIVGGTTLGGTLAVSGTVSLAGVSSGSIAGPGSYIGLNSSNQLVLTASSGTGVAANPAGSNTEVQFNDNGNFGASSNFTFNGSKLQVVGGISGSSTLEIVGATSLGGTLGVTGSTNLSVVTASSIVASGINEGSVIIAAAGGLLSSNSALNYGASGLFVGNNASLSGSVNFFGGYTDSPDVGASYDSSTGQLSLRGNVFAAGTVKAVSGISGSSTLEAVGATTLGSTLAVSGNVTLDGPSSGSIAGPGSYLGLDSNNQIVLTASSGGGAAGNPAGSDTQIQFNDGGSFGASANFTFDANTLVVTGTIKATTLGDQNEIVLVGADNALSSSNLLTIDTANQRIGIGTTSPEVKLHIDGDAAQEAQIRLEQHNNTADAPDIRFRRSRGTHDSPSTLNAGDYAARVNIDIYDGTDYTSAGQFRWDNDGTTSNNSTNTVFGLQTRSSGSTADRITVDGSGNVTFSGKVGIGVSETSITHALTLPNTGDESGRAKANAFVTYSSRRYKKEIKPLESPLEILKKLNGVSYVWKDTDRLDYGFIAEEVGKILPDIVEWAQDGEHANSMDYLRLISFLVEGVKEQDRKIESLENKLDLLIEKIDKLDV